MAKTEYLTTSESAGQIQQSGEAARKVVHFIHLGSVIDQGGPMDKGVNLRV